MFLPFFLLTVEKNPTCLLILHQRGTPASALQPGKTLSPFQQSYFQNLFIGSFKSRLYNFAAWSVVQSPMKLLNSLQLCANPHHGFCCLSSGTVTSDGAQHFNQRFVKPAWRAFTKEIQLFPSSPPPQTVLINTIKLALTPDSDKSRDIREKSDTA